MDYNHNSEELIQRLQELKDSNIDWKLSHEDQVRLKIQWCTKIIREGEIVENEIRRRHFENY